MKEFKILLFFVKIDCSYFVKIDVQYYNKIRDATFKWHEYFYLIWFSLKNSHLKEIFVSLKFVTI